MAVQHERASRSQPRRRSRMVSSTSDVSSCFQSQMRMPPRRSPAMLSPCFPIPNVAFSVAPIFRPTPDSIVSSNGCFVNTIIRPQDGLPKTPVLPSRIPPGEKMDSVKLVADVTSSNIPDKVTIEENCITSSDESNHSNQQEAQQSSPQKPSPTQMLRNLSETSQPAFRIFNSPSPTSTNGNSNVVSSRSHFLSFEPSRTFTNRSSTLLGGSMNNLPLGSAIPPGILGTPFPPSPLDTVYETAAKLLFFAVRWMRGIPSFLHLCFKDQAILLEEAWSDIFVLSAAQWGFPLQDGFLSVSSVHCPEKRPLIASQLQQMKSVMAQLVALQVDSTEFSCLKALVLFRPDASGLRDPVQIELLQDQMQLMLHEYVLTRQPPSKVRFGKLLLILSLARRINAHLIEEVFFRKTIGSIPIERLLCDMFQAS